MTKSSAGHILGNLTRRKEEDCTEAVEELKTGRGGNPGLPISRNCRAERTLLELRNLKEMKNPVLTGRWTGETVPDLLSSEMQMCMTDHI